MEEPIWENLLPCCPGDAVVCFRKHRGVIHVHSAVVYTIRLVDTDGRLRLRIAAENGCTRGIWGVNVFASEDEASKALDEASNYGEENDYREMPEEPVWEELLPFKMGDPLYRLRYHAKGNSFYISQGVISNIYFKEHNGTTALCAEARQVGGGVWGEDVFTSEEAAEAERKRRRKTRVGK